LNAALTHVPLIAMTDWSTEETNNPLLGDDRNFYKVEKCPRMISISNVC
jgi:hypothetical protein